MIFATTRIVTPVSLNDLDQRLHAVAQIHSQHPAADGSVRLLIRLADGQMIESVLLPRDALCVSTQVGCAVGCRFCMTGKSGLIRQVSSLEIVAQVVLARRLTNWMRFCACSRASTRC
jgi:23S rRNA (adenine2503-C2)-methyltransferase